MPFLRHSRSVVTDWQQRYPLLHNYADARNTVHHRWLRWLGFTFIALHEHYGPLRMPFYEFVRITPSLTGNNMIKTHLDNGAVLFRSTLDGGQILVTPTASGGAEVATTTLSGETVLAHEASFDDAVAKSDAACRPGFTPEDEADSAE